MTSFSKREKFTVNSINVASSTEDFITAAKTGGVADQYRGGTIGVVSEGLVQGVGSLCKKSFISITTDASGVPIAATVAGSGGTGITHTATIVSGEVLIKATFAGSGPGSKLTHYVKVTGQSLLTR